MSNRIIEASNISNINGDDDDDADDDDDISTLNPAQHDHEHVRT